MRFSLIFLSALTVVWSGTVSAATLCGTAVVEDPNTDAIFGHLPYAQANAADLVAAPSGFADPGCEALHRDAAAALNRLLAAARADPSVGSALYGVSCFRSVSRQTGIYCSRGRSHAALVSRARTSAPPGHSEHATGYAIDFGDRRRRSCEVSACFADTAAGRWLLANASTFGFEMSFPDGNSQGVAWEPWHWRWVGTSITPDGALTARATFSSARRRYPADQVLPDLPPFAPAPIPISATVFPPSPVR